MLALRQREMPIKYQMGFLLTKQTTGVKQSYLFHMPDILVCIYRVRVGKNYSCQCNRCTVYCRTDFTSREEPGRGENE